MCTWPQTHIDGMNNVWIVKPAGKSRGRGIRLFNDLDQLFAYIKGELLQTLAECAAAQQHLLCPILSILQTLLTPSLPPTISLAYQKYMHQPCSHRLTAPPPHTLSFTPNTLQVRVHWSAVRCVAQNYVEFFIHHYLPGLSTFYTFTPHLHPH